MIDKAVWKDMTVTQSLTLCYVFYHSTGDSERLPVEWFCQFNIILIILKYTCYIKVKFKVFYGQEPPSGESTTTECGGIINYLQ